MHLRPRAASLKTFLAPVSVLIFCPPGTYICWDICDSRDKNVSLNKMQTKKLSFSFIFAVPHLPAEGSTLGEGVQKRGKVWSFTQDGKCVKNSTVKYFIPK